MTSLIEIHADALCIGDEIYDEPQDGFVRVVKLESGDDYSNMNSGAIIVSVTRYNGSPFVFGSYMPDDTLLVKSRHRR